MRWYLYNCVQYVVYLWHKGTPSTIRSQDSSDNPRFEPSSAQDPSDNSRFDAISRFEPSSTRPHIAIPVASRSLRDLRRALSLHILEQVDEDSPGDVYRPEARLNTGGINLQAHLPESNIDGSVHREPITTWTTSTNQPTSSAQLPRPPRNPLTDFPSEPTTSAPNNSGSGREASGDGELSSTSAANQTASGGGYWEQSLDWDQRWISHECQLIV